MAEVAPTGIVSAGIGNMRTLLSESANFQTWVGAASALLALDSIYLIEGPADSASRPFAAIGPAGEFEGDSIAGGVLNQYAFSDTVEILFEEDAAPGLNEPDAYFTFVNTLGAIFADLINPTDTDSFMNITKFSFSFDPARTAEEERQTGGDTMTAVAVFALRSG